MKKIWKSAHIYIYEAELKFHLTSFSCLPSLVAAFWSRWFSIFFFFFHISKQVCVNFQHKTSFCICIKSRYLVSLCLSFWFIFWQQCNKTYVGNFHIHLVLWFSYLSKVQRALPPSQLYFSYRKKLTKQPLLCLSTCEVNSVVAKDAHCNGYFAM